MIFLFPWEGFWLPCGVWSNEWDILEVDPVWLCQWGPPGVTVPVRSAWRQRACINRESVLLQVQVSCSQTEQVQFISTARERDPERVQLHPQCVSFKTSALWIRHLIYLVPPPPPPIPLSHSLFSSRPLLASMSPPLSLLIRPEKGRFFKVHWSPRGLL